VRLRERTRAPYGCSGTHFFSLLRKRWPSGRSRSRFARAKLKQRLRVGEDNSLAPIRLYLRFTKGRLSWPPGNRDTSRERWQREPA